MQVSIQNDGPVTFEIESPLKIATKEASTSSRVDIRNLGDGSSTQEEARKDS